MVDIESIKEARIKAKNRGVKFRYITEVTKKNILYCKEMIKYFDAEIRHLDNVKGNFEVSDDGKEYVAIANLQEAKPLKQLIYSNVKEIGEQQQYVFDTFWNKTISFEEKIKEIEEGIIPEITEIIRNPDKAQALEWNLLSMATKEIQIIYSTVKAYKLQESLGTMDYLTKLSNSGIKVRLLTPKNSSIEESLQNLKNTSSIGINYLETEAAAGIKNKYLIIDRKSSLVIELNDKDDIIDNYYYHLRQKEDENFTPSITPQTSTILGTSIYSNSKSTVLSYLTIFETLWSKTELFEQLKQADILKTEFINIAAHELRTPTQTILGYCEMIDLFPEKKDEYINPIKRNSERLYKLTNDILEVARIESNSLKLDTEKIEINETINETVKDFVNRPLSISNKDVKINFNPSNNKTPSFVYADKNRIQQVIFNLLDNAFKFTEKGEIIVSIMEEEDDDDNDQYNDIKIKIHDTGKGIDTELLSRLFEKFATKSERGTGLGLYISKNIVEAHGGKIWIEKTSNGKGTIFVFTLPTTRMNNHKNTI
jgi:signal transduction histidine kinase